MGGGTWTTSAFCDYSTSVGRSYNTVKCSFDTAYTSQEMFKQRYIHDLLNPKNVMRECRASDEHPNPVPVLFGLDVTGSMGKAAVTCATTINTIMNELLAKYKDIQFCVMGIGDLSCDDAPIQISQYESDVRIAEAMDRVYFEYGGGGNAYESYTAAWYMGSRHCDLDCWKNGKKGIIITLGDEQINPYLPKSTLNEVTGDAVQADIETDVLFEEASQKFHIFHIDVDHRGRHDPLIEPTWSKYLDKDHFKSVGLNEVANTIVEMIASVIDAEEDVEPAIVADPSIQTNEAGEIVW